MQLFVVKTACFAAMLATLWLCVASRAAAAAGNELDLYWIALHGTVEDMRAALPHTSDDKNLALYLALTRNKPAVVEVLLRGGAEVEAYLFDDPYAYDYSGKDTLDRFAPGALRRELLRRIKQQQKEWEEEGIGGDCGSFDPTSELYRVKPEAFEAVFRVQADRWCGHVDACGNKMRNMFAGKDGLPGDKVKLKIYNKYCRK